MYSLRSSGEKSSTQLPGEGTAIEATIYSIWVGIKRGTLLATGLRAYAADPDLQQEWMMVKKVNKMRLTEYIESMSGVKTKRIHKYKKQMLNILALSIDMTISRFEYFKGIAVRLYYLNIFQRTRSLRAKDGTCTRSRCFLLRGSAPRKDPIRLAALLPPSDCLAAQRPPSRLEPA
ncbi:unnamed protein product [Prunus armeniaca]